MTLLIYGASGLGKEIYNLVIRSIPNTYEKFFRSQLGQYPDARSIEAIEALAKYRGTTVSMRAAEAFVLIWEIK